MIPSIRRSLRGLPTYDPTTFLIAFVAWSLFNGFALLSPGNTFQIGPVYSALARLPITEDMWGAILVLDGLAVLATIPYRHLPTRGFVAIVSGTLWAFFGTKLIAGGLEHGYLAAGGAYSVFLAIGCWLAAIQWIAQPEAGA